MKKIYLGADHAGFKLKEQLKSFLVKTQLEYHDLGNSIYDKDDDYPDFAQKVAINVVKKNALGILICGSGMGMCLAASKVKGTRPALVFDVKGARLSREHSDANILCLGGNVVSFSKAKKIVLTWLNTKFSQAARHKRRLRKIQLLEK